MLYAAVTLVAAVVFLLLVSHNSFEAFYALSRSHEAWQLDELFWLFVVGTFALLAILIAHARWLAAEVTLREHAEQAVAEFSRFDEITGLPNRRIFLQSLDDRLRAARLSQSRVAVLVIDIDHFISINDVVGHAGGDKVLSIMAERMGALLRPEDTLARLGSDEFAMIFPLEQNAAVDEVFRFAERLLAAVRQPFHLAAVELVLTASIGIAKFPRDTREGDALLQCAETALLQAKDSGRNRYAVFDLALDARRRGRLELEAELRTGLACGQIVAFYQAVIDLSSRAPVAAEALARWRHPERGLLGPGAFIEMAQDIEVMTPLFEQMLLRVCEDTRNWPRDFAVAVNISPHQLMECTLADKVLNILKAHGYPPERLEIEITETALLLDFDAARRTMVALKERGVRLALDDFGTGYSSLRHLHQLPFDKLKIDRSFVAGVLKDAQSRKIVTSMIGLGKSLGLTVVAEGVELETQADWLRAKGCDLAQGFLFAHPEPPETVARFIRDAPTSSMRTRDGSQGIGGQGI